jgi:hypothetical protein
MGREKRQRKKVREAGREIEKQNLSTSKTDT